MYDRDGDLFVVFYIVPIISASGLLILFLENDIVFCTPFLCINRLHAEIFLTPGIYVLSIFLFLVHMRSIVAR